MQKVREHFIQKLGRPELLGRIGDNIVPFNFIADDRVLLEIARAKLAPLKDAVKEKYKIRDLVFANEEKALRTLCKGADRASGGRGVVNEIVARLIDPLSEFLFREEEDRANYAGRQVRVLQAGESATFCFSLE